MITTKKRYAMVTKLLFFSSLVLCLASCKGQTKTSLPQEKIEIKNEPAKVRASEITLKAELLPEFKTSPYETETEGFQISGVVRTMFQDAEDHFWFGTQNGLARYDGEALVYFDLKNEQKKGFAIKAITQDLEGTIWIGHYGGITKFDGEYFTTYTEKNGLLNNDVWKIKPDKKGNIWIGTLEGLCKFDGTTFTPFELPEGKPDTTKGVTSAKIVHSIIEDSKGTMWFANNGGIHKYDGTTLTTYSEENGLDNNFVNNIIEDSKGIFWISSQDGLCKFDGTTFTTVTKDTIVTDEGVGSVIEDNEQNIWFAIKNAGVYRYNGKGFKNYNTDLGPFTNVVFEIYQDHKNRIWFVGFKGAYRLDGDKVVNVTRTGPW